MRSCLLFISTDKLIFDITVSIQVLPKDLHSNSFRRLFIWISIKFILAILRCAQFIWSEPFIQVFRFNIIEHKPYYIDREIVSTGIMESCCSNCTIVSLLNVSVLHNSGRGQKGLSVSGKWESYTSRSPEPGHYAGRYLQLTIIVELPPKSFSVWDYSDIDYIPKAKITTWSSRLVRRTNQSTVVDLVLERRF